ncbi:hemolysin family protein [Gemmatimonadota bacterium]
MTLETATWHLILLGVLLLLSGFFSSSETALFFLGKGQISEMERSDRGASRRVAFLLSKPRRLLVGILVGNTLVNIAAASLGTVVAIDLLTPVGSGQAVGEGILWATVIMTILILFVGEIAPKSFALENATRLAPLISRPLLIFLTFIKPLRVVLMWVNDLLLALLRPSLLEGPDLSSDELTSAIEEGYDAGILDTFEREVINNLLDMEQRTVGDIMTPRVEIVSMDSATPPGEWKGVFHSSGFSRTPVTAGDLDTVDGILYARDVLAAQAGVSASPDLSILVRPPWFVPESMKAMDLLGEFRDRQVHLALVIDEYGSVSGLVTMEDVLEEIVGDIADPRGEEAPFRLIEKGIAVVYAGWELDEFSREVGIEMHDRFSETVGGWIVNSLGRIPVSGETLDLGSFRFHVLAASPTRVLWLRVEWGI